MKIIRTKDYQDMSRKAANIISAQMILKDEQRTWTCNRFYSNRYL